MDTVAPFAAQLAELFRYPTPRDKSAATHVRHDCVHCGGPAAWRGGHLQRQRGRKVRVTAGSGGGTSMITHSTMVARRTRRASAAAKAVLMSSRENDVVVNRSKGRLFWRVERNRSARNRAGGS